ncbi:MAG: primosomal protein N' (replication factor Y) [Candidatus Azotimanducaceae bacterium]|jgi:primosomal protein N' (replication factor Y)
MSIAPTYADLIVPVPVPRTFTYFIPTELREQIGIGQRVVVPFGKRKAYAAIVAKLHHNPPKAYEAKDIVAILDDIPLVSEKHISIWQWVAAYYMCGIGEVMNAAMPAVFKLQSETRVVFNPDFEEEEEVWNDKEAIALDALKLSEVLSISDLESILGVKNVMPTVKSLMESGVLHLEEEVKQRYKVKTVHYVHLNVSNDKEGLESVFEGLKRAQKQSQLLLHFLNRSTYGKNPVLKTELLQSDDFTAGHLKSLKEKGVLRISSEEISRQIGKAAEVEDALQLSEKQQKALAEIEESFITGEVSLLHGVTSSGKTAVYIELIKQFLDKGEDILYLLPEIALTTQIIQRLQFHFGEKVLVYHSKLNNNERADIWKSVHADKPGRVLIGTRSSVFLPIKKLGLIIVDEEHESSFKQQDPAPRYHARDLAIVLGAKFKCKVLLGSATPSIETLYNVQLNKYAKIDLTERYGGVAMPEVSFINMKKARLHKMVQGDFSDELIAQITTNIADKKQIILFQNRRGFAPMVECQLCGWTPQCKSCDISLTYHKAIHRLKCHYCGYNEPVALSCGSCGAEGMVDKGLGTEKIEEELHTLFPDITVGRMDQDTTRKKDALPQLIEKFGSGEIDILVGTQMLTKGLDFDNVGMVGVLNADNMLHFPDFRAFERSFQLLTQVAGRAGRRADVGKVFIQTYNPDHPVLRDVASQDIAALYQEQIAERKAFGYPPIVRMVRITIKHKNYHTVNEAAELLAGPLRQKFGRRVLGPEFPSVARIRNLYNKHFILKLEKQHASGLKKDLQAILNGFALQGGYTSVRIVVDVDPY